MHRSQLIPGRIVPQKNVSGASDNSKELSKSSVSSKCLTAEQSLQGQIVQLKQKAHQSFMQVIQMQQLHQEELEQLREEFNAKEQEFADREAQFMRKQEEFQRREEQFKQKEKEWQSRVHELQQKVKKMESTVRSGPDDPEGRAKEWEQLEVRVKQLQFENATLEKNYKHHICEFQQDDLQIDNIELITCRQQSRLDDSAIINFTEIVNFHRPQEQLAVLKEETRKEVETLAGRPCAQTPLGPMLDRLFEYIALLRSELTKLQQKGTERQKEREPSQNKFYESLQKETKFMADHIKRLSAEKLKLEKRLQEMQRQNKAQEERLRKVDASLARRGIKLSEVAPAPPEDHQKSLEINEFISQTFKNSSNNPTHKAQYGILRKTKN